MISCRTCTNLHTESREGVLRGWQRLMYRFHMRMCPHCQAYAKGLEQTDAALDNVPTEPAPDDLKQRLAERMRARHVR